MGRKGRKKIKWKPLDSVLQQERVDEPGEVRVQVKKLSADSPPFVPQSLKDRQKSGEFDWNDRGHRVSQGPLLLAVPAFSLRPVNAQSRQRHLVAIARGSSIALPAVVWHPYVWYPATGAGTNPVSINASSPRPQPTKLKDQQDQEMASKSEQISPPPPGAVSQYYRLCTEPETDEIVVHEVEESDSECGSEDVDTLGHRYENNRPGARTGHQVSLATEIFHATEPETTTSGALGCITNTHVLRGFYGDPAPHSHGDEEKLNLSGMSGAGESNVGGKRKEETPLIYARSRRSIRQWLCCHCTIM